MQAVLSLVQTDAMGAQLLMRPFVVTGLVSLSSPQHLAATTSWPHSSEEGSNNAQSMLSLVASILHNPFLPGAAPDSLVRELQEVMQPFMCQDDKGLVARNTIHLRITETHHCVSTQDLVLGITYVVSVKLKSVK